MKWFNTLDESFYVSPKKDCIHYIIFGIIMRIRHSNHVIFITPDIAQQIFTHL